MKYSKEPLTFVLLDVDHFKEINDTYGHQVGDHVLRRVANGMDRWSRSTDYVFRIGGDEFVLILRGLTKESADVIINRLEEFREYIRNDPDEILDVSICMGVAFSAQGFTEDLYERADALLYRAKEERGTICAETLNQ